jgi:hypothetical protein
MNKLGLSFHHFGLAVKHPSFSVIFLSALDYVIGNSVLDTAQNIRLIMCVHECQPAVEIIYPGNGPGPVDALVERYTSGIIYHGCYETNNLGVTLSECENSGLRADCVIPPTPALLFNGRNVSFYRIKGIGLIEILEP